MSGKTFLLILLSFTMLTSGCGFAQRDQNNFVIQNNAYGTPRDVMLDQFVEPINGFNCHVVATIAADDYEPLESCSVILGLGGPNNLAGNHVFFYKDMYVGHGNINEFPARFAKHLEEQRKKVIEESIPYPSSLDGKELILIGSGSGFYINNDGYLITNYHVVNDCSQLSTTQNKQNVPLTMIYTDPKNDLAVLKLKEKVLNYATFRLGKGLKRGDEITVIGYPLQGLLSSDAIASFGYVNALSGIHDDSSRIQISAPIQPGNSGGPVLDNNGNVVGIIVSSVSDRYLYENTGTIPQNANFAINGLMVISFLDAREIAYSTAYSSETLSKSDIAEKGVAFTAQILCYK